MNFEEDYINNKFLFEEHLKKLRNGRISLDGNKELDNYSIYESSNRGNNIYKKEALKTIDDLNKKKRRFFSEENLNFLTNIITHRLLNNAEETINTDHLKRRVKYIMNSVYNNVDEIEKLNNTVINDFIDYSINGRVKIDIDSIKTNFNLYQELNSGNKNYKNEALKTILSNYREPLHCEFFSKKNIDLLQTSIIKNIYNLSNGKYKIKRQSDRELKLIMRSIYLQYSQHKKCNIKKQIYHLNKKILEYALPNILTNIKQFIGYKRDVDYLPIPLNNPQNLSIKGTKY